MTSVVLRGAESNFTVVLIDGIEGGVPIERGLILMDTVSYSGGAAPVTDDPDKTQRLLQVSAPLPALFASDPCSSDFGDSNALLGDACDAGRCLCYYGLRAVAN